MATGQDLKKYLKSRPELLGDKVVKKFGDDLPFLFKVRFNPLACCVGVPMADCVFYRSLPSARRCPSRPTPTSSSPRSCTPRSPTSTRVSFSVLAVFAVHVSDL
jgi:hypothetical protein